MTEIAWQHALDLAPRLVCATSYGASLPWTLETLRSFLIQFPSMIDAGKTPRRVLSNYSSSGWSFMGIHPWVAVLHSRSTVRYRDGLGFDLISGARSDLVFQSRKYRHSDIAQKIGLFIAAESSYTIELI